MFDVQLTTRTPFFIDQNEVLQGGDQMPPIVERDRIIHFPPGVKMADPQAVEWGYALLSKVKVYGIAEDELGTIIEKDAFVSVEDFEVGLRSDGVIVWRKKQ